MIIRTTLPLIGEGTDDSPWEAINVGGMLDYRVPCRVTLLDLDPTTGVALVEIETTPALIGVIRGMQENGRWDEIADGLRAGGQRLPADPLPERLDADAPGAN